MYNSPRHKRGIRSLHLAAALVPIGIAAVVSAQDFFMGSDISLLTFEQQQGMTFSDTNGIAATADQILYNHGDNLFRLRVFVNPNTNYSPTGGAIQTTAYDIALAQQLKADDPSAKFELDFHYSDTWADPGHQSIPAAWSGQPLSTLESSVQSYTTTTLQSFEAAGVTPDIVQVGNEINSGMLWPTGQLTFPKNNPTLNTTQWQAFGGLINSAIAGVQAAQTAGPKMQVAVTIAQGNQSGEPQFFFGDLTNPTLGDVPAANIDVMGVDYYPTKTTDLATMQSNLTALANTFNKKIIVEETDAPWESTSVSTDPNFPKTPAGQQAYLTALANMVKGLPNNDGEGLLYWYPESVQVPGLFDYNGGATALFGNTTAHVATAGVNAFAASQHQWNTSASSDWNTSGNWTNGSPNGAGVEADFFSAIGSMQTISTSSAITLGTMNFNNANSYIIGGTGSLTLQDQVGYANVVVQSGAQQISVPVTIAGDTIFTVYSGAALQFTSPVVISPGQTLSPAGSGIVSYTSTVAVSTGASMTFANSTHAQGLAVAPSATASVTSPTGSTVLTLDNLSNSGTINLENNEMILNYSGTDPISDIRAELISGYNNGLWNGAGITSSAAAANHTYGLGYADGADNVVTGLSSGQIEIRFTLYGDANLDGIVSGSDFTILASGLGHQVSGWDQGDFNYDGVISGADFTVLVEDLGHQANGSAITLPAADFAAIDAFAAANGLMADVPEPTSAALLATAAIGLCATRRRRRR